MTAQHTPGPWKVRKAKWEVDGEWDFAIGATINGLECCIAEVFGRAGYDIRPEAEANARLIAAAPEAAAERDRLRAVNAELLAALKGLEHEMADCWDDLLPATQERLRDARAAIAKAEQS